MTLVISYITSNVSQRPASTGNSDYTGLHHDWSSVYSWLKASVKMLKFCDDAKIISLHDYDVTGRHREWTTAYSWNLSSVKMLQADFGSAGTGTVTEQSVQYWT